MAALAMLIFAGPASAHVTVDAPGAVQGGGDQIITFRVPTESDAASTTGFKLLLPSDTPIASVQVQPLAGWSFTATTTKLPTAIKTDDGDVTQAVSEIDWKADSKAAGIAPGQFQQFVIIAGLLPDTSKLVFRAIQNYSDGTTVSWTDVPAVGSTVEPEHAAPTLLLGAKTADDKTPAPSTAAPSTAATTTKSTSTTVPTALAIAGIVLAALALALALRRPRSAPRS